MSKLDKKPVFYNTNYSPVVNDVMTYSIIDENDRFNECKRILNTLGQNEKTLIYFPTVANMYRYITSIIASEPKLKSLDNQVFYFIEWAKEEIHEEWCLITALERGYLIHNGQIPIGTRLFQLDYYEQSEVYNKLLCTSTLLVLSDKQFVIRLAKINSRENATKKAGAKWHKLKFRVSQLFK